MRLLKLAMLTVLLVLCAGVASAAGWTTTAGGSVACTSMTPGATCWTATGGAATSALHVQKCGVWQITVWATGASVTPQSCTDDTCGTVEDLVSTALTGDPPNTGLLTQFPFTFIRLNTASSVTVSITCGKQG